mmetsp:Transcript_41720/g.95734  ORF Transcript_41720/g.95734 Transcript_41720/m.95734 type:complete len:232 (+) Transcript_41720:1797-2492(+)
MERCCAKLRHAESADDLAPKIHTSAASRPLRASWLRQVLCTRQPKPRRSSLHLAPSANSCIASLSSLRQAIQHRQCSNASLRSDFVHAAASCQAQSKRRMCESSRRVVNSVMSPCRRNSFIQACSHLCLRCPSTPCVNTTIRRRRVTKDNHAWMTLCNSSKCLCVQVSVTTWLHQPLWIWNVRQVRNVHVRAWFTQSLWLKTLLFFFRLDDDKQCCQATSAVNASRTCRAI